MNPEQHQSAPSPTQTLLPHDKAAEQGLLGAILQHNEWLERIAGHIAPRHFFSPAHRIIFETMLALYREKAPIDEITIGHRLRLQGRMDQVGGLTYLAELVDLTPSASNAITYQDLVLRCAKLRDFIGRSETAAAEAREGGDPDALIRAQIAHLESLEDHARNRAGRTYRDLTIAVMEDIEAIQAGTRVPSLIRTFTGLDDLWTFERGFPHLIAAGTGVGKSALARNIAERNAASGRPVVIFNLEMEGEQTLRRAISERTGYATRVLREVGQDAHFWDSLSASAADIAGLPITIFDFEDANTLDQIGSSIRASILASATPPELVIIDHLALIRIDDDRAGETEKMVRRIEGLRRMAKRFAVPFLILAQINREGAKASRPELWHIKGSGDIENACHAIAILHDRSAKAETPNFGERYIEARVVKHREGPLGTKSLWWEPERTRFDHEVWRMMREPGRAHAFPS